MCGESLRLPRRSLGEGGLLHRAEECLHRKVRDSSAQSAPFISVLLLRAEAIPCGQFCLTSRVQPVIQIKQLRSPMENSISRVTLLLIAVALLLSVPSVKAETCQEKRDACVASCDQKRPAEKAFCIKKCDDQLKECVNKSRPQPLDITNDADFDACLEGGLPCRQPVRKICMLMAGACDDCWKSLCGGNWLFGSSMPLEVKLLAATDPAKNGRVLATSSMKGKQAALRVPADIKLNKNEQLYFEFSSKEKPAGTIKVHVHRGS